MTAFLSPHIIALGVFVEVGAPGDHLVHTSRTFLHDYLDDLSVAQTIACYQGIINMLFKAVLLQVIYDGYAPLSVLGVSLIGAGLGKYCDRLIREELGCLYCKGEPCNA